MNRQFLPLVPSADFDGPPAILARAVGNSRVADRQKLPPISERPVTEISDFTSPRLAGAMQGREEEQGMKKQEDQLSRAVKAMLSVRDVPAVEKLSDAGWRTFASGVIYCDGARTNRLPAAVAGGLYPGGTPQAVIDELVTARLWYPMAGAYEVALVAVTS